MTTMEQETVSLTELTPGTENLTYSQFLTPGPTDTSTTMMFTLPDHHYNLIRDTYFVLSGIVISVGLVCNTLALAVFGSSKALRSTTTAHYLMALSVADSLCLVTEMFRWLAQQNTFGVGANLLNTSSVMCKGVFVLRYLGHMASAWITAAITTERFITIRFPLKVSRISTMRAAKIMIGVIYVVCGALSLYPIWVVGLGPYKDRIICLITNTKYYEIGQWVTIRVGVLLVPSVIVCVLTAYIICLLKAREKMQYRLKPHNKFQRADTKVRKAKSLERQLTGMLLAVAVAFVILRLPYIIMYYINSEKSKIWGPLDPHVKYDIYVAYKLTDVLAVSNYAINFFLYFVCGSTFRKQLAAMFRCREPVARRRPSLSGGSVSTSFSRHSGSMYARSGVTKGLPIHFGRPHAHPRDIELHVDAICDHNMCVQQVSYKHYVHS